MAIFVGGPAILAALFPDRRQAADFVDLVLYFCRLGEAAPDADCRPPSEEDKDGERIPKTAGNDPLTEGCRGEDSGQQQGAVPNPSASQVVPAAEQFRAVVLQTGAGKGAGLGSLAPD